MDEENTECFITEKKGRNLIFENLVELKVIEGLDLSDDFLKKNCCLQSIIEKTRWTIQNNIYWQCKYDNCRCKSWRTFLKIR